MLTSTPEFVSAVLADRIRDAKTHFPNSEPRPAEVRRSAERRRLRLPTIRHGTSRRFGLFGRRLQPGSSIPGHRT